VTILKYYPSSYITGPRYAALCDNSLPLTQRDLVHGKTSAYIMKYIRKKKYKQTTYHHTHGNGAVNPRRGKKGRPSMSANLIKSRMGSDPAQRMKITGMQVLELSTISFRFIPDGLRKNRPST
jgi:hypothetical protein